MAKTYLDETGLAILWGKIKTYVTNAVKVTGVKGNAETSYRTGNVNLTADNVGALPYNGTIFNTNSFASEKYRKLYISKIDNAFFALDKRYNVTVTYDGTNVSNVAQFFDGNYEGNSLHIANGKTATFTLDFSSGSSQKFAGYPYGYVYISFYNECIPGTITGRVYNNYASQGVGWHDITFEQYGASMYRARQSYYGLQTLEITMTGSSNTPYGYTSPVEIEMQIDRPDPTQHSSIINKYSAQTLYYSLTAPKFIGALQGNADTATTATKATQDKNGKDITTWYQSLGNNMTDIASGTDLNTIITPGNYRATSTSIGSSLVNCPVATWFIMRVGYADGKSTGWEYQEILVGNSGVRWYRHHNGGTWASWQEFAKNTDTVTTVAYDSTNAKLTKTINGTTSDIVTLSTLKTAMSLNNVANGAEVNQNAFSNVKVGSTTVAADSKTDTIELVAGSNITLTPDATNDKITIAAKDTVTTVTTTGSGNAVTGITASNGALTATKGSTFLTQHQNAISGVNSNYTEDGTLYRETVDAPLPQSSLDLSSHNNIVATSLSAGSTGSVNVYLDLAIYGTCSTAGATAAKAVTGIKGFALNTGSIVAVKFTNTNIAAESTLTLNVNGTGAKPIKYRGGTIPANKNHLSAGRFYWFVYDGTNYEIIGDLEFTYPTMTQAEATEGTLTTARVITPAVLKTTIANAVGDAGGGDMTKAVYDTNNDGKVDNADNAITWNSIRAEFQTDYTSALLDADLIVAGYPYAHYEQYHKPIALSSVLATVTPSEDAIARYDSNSRLHSAAPVATSNDTTVATTAFVNTFVSNAIDNAKDKIVDITNQFSSSNSRITIASAYKCGKTISLEVGLLRSSSWGTGANNDISSTITSTYLPLHTEYCAHLWGSGAVYGTLTEGNSSGNATVTFRNNSGGSISASSGNYLHVAFTYIYNDGTIS